jgi:hypothetical protein
MVGLAGGLVLRRGRRIVSISTTAPGENTGRRLRFGNDLPTIQPSSDAPEMLMRDDFQAERPQEPQPLDYPELAPSRYPPLVLAAGIIWIVFGFIILLDAAALLLLVAGGEAQGAFAGGQVCGTLFVGLIGGAFIFVGVQSVKGTAPDTLGNGIGSLLFGGLEVVMGVFQARDNILAAGVGFLAAAGLITAGVLALAGRIDYKAWQQEHKPRRPRARR